MIRSEIILDSISPAGDRLVTYECTFNRFILSELNTHRLLTRNVASSRARPISKMIESLHQDPAEIVCWGKNQSGMQAREELDDIAKLEVKALWNEHMHQSISVVEELAKNGLHKQLTNRLLEPFLNVTAVITATDWSNFFALRCHPDAQPEIQKLAFCMLRDYYDSTPTELQYGEWHTPYITDEEKDLDIELRKKISVAKCARVSYTSPSLTREYEKELELYERLCSSKHLSPMEHVATPTPDSLYHGNFKGWKQMRKFMSREFLDWTFVPSKVEVEQYFNALKD